MTQFWYITILYQYSVSIYLTFGLIISDIDEVWSSEMYKANCVFILINDL